ILHYVALFLVCEIQIELDVVVIYDIHQSREPSIVEEAALVRRFHEHTVLPDEYSRQIRSLVGAIRRAVGGEAVDTDLGGLMQIPAGLGPQRLYVAVVALCLAAKQFVSTTGRCFVEIHSGLWG